MLGYSAERDLASSLPSLRCACRHSVPGGCPALWGNVPFRASSPRLLSCFHFTIEIFTHKTKAEKSTRTSCGHSYFTSLLCLDPLRLLWISFHLHILSYVFLNIRTPVRYITMALLQKISTEYYLASVPISLLISYICF